MKKIVMMAAALALAGCSAGGQAATPMDARPATTTEAQLAPSSTQADSFLVWAGTHKVGEIDLPALVAEHPAGVAELGRGYCPLLTGKPLGDAETVVLVIKRNTNGSSRQAAELLEQAIAAYCPEKSRLLN